MLALPHLALCLAAVPPAVWLQPGEALPGDAVLVRVAGAGEEPEGELGEEALDFAPLGEAWVALLPLSVDQEAATLPLSVRLKSGGGELELGGALEVKEANFPRRELSVSKKFTSPDRRARKRMREDQRAFERAFAQDFAPPGFQENFELPRVAVPTAPFGDLRMFNGKRKSQHYGLDLDGQTGDPIYASNTGVVVMARDCFGSGQTVLLHHGLSLFTSYFHLSKIDVKAGQKVKRGQLLGKVGKTGRVTGPHLHFGAKLDGKWVNPESVLRLDFVGPLPPRAAPGADRAVATTAN